MATYETPPLNEPKILPPDYVQSVDNLSAQDFLTIFLETLRYQDPFTQTDISKSLDDIVKLNEIKYFTEMREFLSGLKTWLNQMTFMNAVSLIGRDFIFRTEVLDTLSGNPYYIVSEEDYDEVKVVIYDGQEPIKEIRMELKRGLNELDTSSLPEGQFTVKVFYREEEITGWSLGFKQRVSAVGVLGDGIVLELEDGSSVPADSILFAGG
ncbi:MAG: flagellar hook assembly protein FlgD [Aquificae bacterium]|nr:flagellar hook assembly protein FlgD [Aquificota bacterium]